MTSGRDFGWVMVIARLPADPARHRMAAWRELRRAGAIPVGQGVWALPDVPAAALLMERLEEVVSVADGTLLVLQAQGYRAMDAERLSRLYQQAREQEWAEFLADCDKYLAELDREVSLGKFTLAELEEEEQSLDRLRRWCRELRSRDLSGGAGSPDGIAALKGCEERFDAYADRVYAALGGITP